MSNLPKELPSIKAFEQSPLTIRLDMYSGFVAPTEIVFEIYASRVKKYEVTGSYDSGSRRITADFTAEQIKAMPLIADCLIRFDDQYPFRVQIKPTTSGSDDGVVGYTIEQAGDSYTVIQILGMDLVEAQVTIATEKAEEATLGATTATTQAGIATTGANVATTKAIEAAGSADTSTTMAGQAVAARDETVALLAQKMDMFFVNTYADLVTFVSNPSTGPCGVLVLSDESYEVGTPRWHVYSGAGGVSGLVRFITYTENA